MAFIKTFIPIVLVWLISLPLYAADSDGDGVDDATDNCSSVANADQLDTDSDGLGNACDADDDGDNVIDSLDAFPLDKRYKEDTDNDGLPDAYETANGLNPNNASDASSDADGDGLTVLEEFGYGTSDSNTDSDFDTLPDKSEVNMGRNPAKSDFLGFRRFRSVLVRFWRPGGPGPV